MKEIDDERDGIGEKPLGSWKATTSNRGGTKPGYVLRNLRFNN